jgi:hypothetical protein
LETDFILEKARAFTLLVINRSYFNIRNKINKRQVTK